MIKVNSKSQSWSVDIFLGVIIFVTAFIIFYLIINSNPQKQISNLKEDAGVVIKQIASDESPIRVVDGTEVNTSKLEELKNLTYDELKRRLRIEGDFCIYFEDEKGDIILMNNSYRGIGSPNINLSGVPCSQK